MEALFVLLFLLLILVAIGGFCGIYAVSKLGKLNAQMNSLHEQIKKMQRDSLVNSQPNTVPNESSDANSLAQRSPPHVKSQSLPIEPPPSVAQPTPMVEQAPPQSTPPNTLAKRTEPSATTEPSLSARLGAQFKEHWMVWIGALALAFGGIFFVNYSLEAGLLSVTARLSLGAAFGVFMLVAAEYTHRRFYRDITASHAMVAYVPAALAAGGYISLFALTALALISYQLLSPMSAFAMLTVVSLAASWNALRFGPLLAVIGMLGAYSVPLWVSTGSSNYLALIVYLSVLTLNLTYVVRKVRRMWLWYSIWALHLLWLLLIAIDIPRTQSLAMLLFVPLSVLLLILIPRLGFSLSHVEHRVWSFRDAVVQKPDNILLLVIMIAAAVFSARQYSDILATQFWIMSAVFALASVLNSRWQLWPLVSVVFLAFLLDQPYPIGSDLNHDGLLVFYGALGQAQIAMLAFLLFGAVIAVRSAQHIGFTLIASGAVIVPLMLSYLALPTQWLNDVKWFWVLELLLGAALLVFMANRTRNTLQQMIYWCAVNAHLSFCATLMLGTHALTLALASQVVLMCYVGYRLRQSIPSWLLKLLAMVVLTRLTLLWFEPGATVEQQGASLWLYPTVAVLFTIAYRLFAQSQLKPWLLGAILHVCAMWVSTLTSYFIVGHAIDLYNLSLVEKLVLGVNWGILGCVYLYRSEAAQSMAKFYQVAASILFACVAAMHLSFITKQNPWFERIEVGEGLLSSLSWLYYFAPSCVLLWLGYYLRDRNRQLATGLLAAAGVYLFVFINALVRQYWQGTYIHLGLSVSDAELYSYSVIWLVLGASIVAFSLTKNLLNVQRVGIALLALVIAKVFLIDMANLTGLLRALSFIGLGLALVGLGALFKWLERLHMPREQTSG
ncbi:DUF2339 domain-containing protein [Pseudoalteromonas sp. SSDWG2]|uniref:DUF2339 domain-containing protein n=1 Tax=Pseudoalteromonas sp. SSDWG2 TaxID=3139391 RepID=UPI003BABE0E2